MCRQWLWVGLFAAWLVGCGKAKEEALQGAEQIEAACKADKKEEAAKLGAELYGKNEVFKKAVDGAAQTWNVSDVSKFPYCGVAFIEVKTRIGS